MIFKPFTAMVSSFAITLMTFAFPALASRSLPRGPSEAPVTIMMYGDFECPFTQRSAEIVTKLQAAMPGETKLVFRHFPLSFHPNARTASHAAICAGEQGKFWEMHDELFKVPRGQLNPERMAMIASEIGANMAEYKSCLESARAEKEVVRDIEEGELVKVGGTPNFVISGPNGLKKMNGAYPLEDMMAAVKEVR